MAPSALRHGIGALRHGIGALRHDARQELGLRYNFCIVTEGRDTARQRAFVRSDTVGHRGDTAGEGATIRPNARHDTTLCARPVPSLGQGWVHYALDLVFSQNTILSHCLGHCS